MSRARPDRPATIYDVAKAAGVSHQTVSKLLRGLGEWRMILYSLLLIVTMWLRPQGLLGRRELALPRWR